MAPIGNFRLKVFRTVAERLSFRQAAEVLYLTQPAVTQQIKALECEVGLPLFDRNGDTIQLSVAGKVLLPYARKMAGLVAEAERELSILRGQEQGELKIGASTTIAQYLLPKLIGEFSRVNPGIHLSVVGANTAQIVTRLLDRGIALGLVEGPSLRRDLKVEKFLADEIAVVVPAGHEWIGHAVTPDQLATAKLIMREEGSGTRRVVEAALRQLGIHVTEQNLAMELDSTEAIKSAVEAGLGIGFVARRALHNEFKLGTLTELTVKRLTIERQFTILTLRGPEPVGPAGTFLRFLRSVRDSRSVEFTP